MSSWNEKLSVTPTVNVNLAPCAEWCRVRTGVIPGADHSLHCPGKPAPIPCPIPRSVTLTVRLGECNCGHDSCVAAFEVCKTGHLATCPARPVRVSCDIGGDGTWAGSRVEDVEVPSPDEEPSAVLVTRAGAACRDRWALVKAVVTGQRHDGFIGESDHGARVGTLTVQRDMVFSALAAQTRLEAEMLAAQQATVAAIAAPRLTTGETRPEDRPSARALAVYVERLIEQVSVLQ